MKPDGVGTRRTRTTTEEISIGNMTATFLDTVAMVMAATATTNVGLDLMVQDDGNVIVTGVAPQVENTEAPLLLVDTITSTIEVTTEVQIPVEGEGVDQGVEAGVEAGVEVAVPLVRIEAAAAVAVVLVKAGPVRQVKVQGSERGRGVLGLEANMCRFRVKMMTAVEVTPEVTAKERVAGPPGAEVTKMMDHGATIAQAAVKRKSAKDREAEVTETTADADVGHLVPSRPLECHLHLRPPAKRMKKGRRIPRFRFSRRIKGLCSLRSSS